MIQSITGEELNSFLHFVEHTCDNNSSPLFMKYNAPNNSTNGRTKNRNSLTDKKNKAPSKKKKFQTTENNIRYTNQNTDPEEIINGNNVEFPIFPLIKRERQDEIQFHPTTTSQIITHNNSNNNANNSSLINENKQLSNNSPKTKKKKKKKIIIIKIGKRILKPQSENNKNFIYNRRRKWSYISKKSPSNQNEKTSSDCTLPPPNQNTISPGKLSLLANTFRLPPCDEIASLLSSQQKWKTFLKQTENIFCQVDQ